MLEHFQGKRGQNEKDEYEEKMAKAKSSAMN
jgi:hypothetical protein